MKFSIIVPVYNVKEYLDECIRNVVEQSYTDWELILVNDGSTDFSGTICDCWTERDGRVRTIHKANGGASTARNRGLCEISGQYVLFLDGDDYWLANDFLEQLARRIEQTEADVVVYNLQKEYDGRKEPAYFSETITMPPTMSDEESLRFIAEKELWTACAWNKAVKVCCFENNQLRFYEGITSEDIDWCIRLALVAKRFDYLAVCAVSYRQRSGSVTSSATPEKIRQLADNIRRCLCLLDEAENEQAIMLRPYVAYQYGTFVYNIAMLPASKEQKQLISDAKAMTNVLEWSENSKIRTIRKVQRICGFNMMLRLLWLKGKMDSIRMRRSD